ncbi:MAG: DegT/DnrJ/EryC1/StrS family aminotransferase [Sphingomonadales bacterium]
MRPLQMVDTKTQYLHIKKEVDQAVAEVLDAAAYINGPAVRDFAAQLATYLSVKHVIPCANGTDALQIALMALDLKPGDEVVTPSFTYIATTEVIALLRLRPVFVEVDSVHFCMDPLALEKAITPRTKAIVPVHLYGQAAPMKEILEIAQRYGISIVEDNAQAIGCDYYFTQSEKKKTGTMGSIGCTSFYPSKNLGAFGDGGALFTNDDELASRIQMIANHGQSKRYYHDVVGCNSRLDTIQAAILSIKLRYLDQYNAARQRAADFYDRAFSGCAHLMTPYRAAYGTHVFHQYTLRVTNGQRDALASFLSTRQIPCMIYYPVPGHRQKMFDSFQSAVVDLPVTDLLTEQVISLPIHTELDQEQLGYIANGVLDFFK